jgi:hypothetical protein
MIHKEYEDKLAITRSNIALLKLQLKAIENDIESLQKSQHELTMNHNQGTPRHSNVLSKRKESSKTTPSFHHPIQFHSGNEGKSAEGDDDGIWNTPDEEFDNEGAGDDDESLPPRVLSFK